MQGSFPPCTGIITPLTSEFPRWQIVRCVVYSSSVCTRYYRHYLAWNCLVMLNVHPQPSLAQQGGNLVFCNVHPKKILTHRQAPGARPPAGRCKRQGITNQDETQLLRFVRI